MAKTLLQSVNLYCERDQRVLFENLDISVSAGEVLQVEGPNGSGKTTLLRILTGLSDAYEGDLLWQGQPLQKVRESYYQEMQYLGHSAGIKQALTAEENLQWYAVIQAGHLNAGSSSQQRAGNIADILAKVGLRGYEDVPCHTLSAGQQRRVNLARLYLSSATLWILDEPFTAIDKNGIATIETLIEEHVKSGGTVIITTHQDLKSVPNLRKITLGEVLPA
jgi:heme exporter protein A